MASSSPSFERIAMNRVSFGARDLDVAYIQRIGWPAWMAEQLAPPAGDDPDLAAHIASQILHIEYEAYEDNQLGYRWKALSEDRPLNYLRASLTQIWQMARSIPWSNAFAESTRMETELCAGIYMRNAHSRFQVREFMTDFWLNHFSIGKNKGTLTSAPLISYDRDVIRPNVFGNFRTLLGAVAKSTSMLWYLDNKGSTATIPNENYARELMELHTMGRDAYFGKNSSGADVSAKGFTDDDILQASRALSGWTVRFGQPLYFTDAAGNLSVISPDDGLFTFNPEQHNKQAGRFLGFNLASVSNDIAQGEKVLDLVANHAATAPFICGKLCRRIFGDSPPQAVIDRAVAAFIRYRDAPDQIKRVLEAIVLDGPEIGTGPAVKIRRPYERFIALVRLTDSVINAGFGWDQLAQDLNDSPFIWPTPDGRPDSNQFWLSTYVHVNTWELMKQITLNPAVKVSFRAQTPVAALPSAEATVDYWVDRLIGGRLNDQAMNALYTLTRNISPYPGNGYWDNDFGMRVIATIAAAPEFVLR